MEGMNKRHLGIRFKRGRDRVTVLDKSGHAVPAVRCEFLRRLVPRNSLALDAPRARVDPRPQGRAGQLRWDVSPALIGESPAETAETPGAAHPRGETAKMRTAVSARQPLLRHLAQPVALDLEAVR